MAAISKTSPNRITSLESDERQLRFMQSFAAAYRRIFACILTIIPHRQEADDVMQNVCAVLWDKFDEFEEGTNFANWACTIAFFEAKNHARRERRRRSFGLNDTVLSKLEQMRVGSSELLELRRQELANCLSGLKKADHAMLLKFYGGDLTAKEIAKREGRSINALYVKLNRLRRRLADCVQRGLMGGSV
ncbi:sigma-70 family RNA polymerase sigma factor [Calycomorphotria hydatis]|uniref:RNA polymerase sigma factor n=1 Tax=Calycomorphotria hydatis TaxID=2528027 RepID=A0A517T8L7_9PLAN|nr:sigma-70 family RNA polymerase sigma factor [Calycomorphotria hydatis]QDT64730.1 RNA polymerase sigma factor [Calycomorphotria hydatis]